MKKLKAKLNEISGAKVLTRAELTGVIGIQGGSGGCGFPIGSVCPWECFSDGDCGPDGAMCVSYSLEGDGWKCDCRRCRSPH